MGVIHQIAHCQDCNFYNDDHKNARKKAREHVKKTGHTVNGETGIGWTIKKK